MSLNELSVFVPFGGCLGVGHGPFRSWGFAFPLRPEALSQGGWSFTGPLGLLDPTHVDPLADRSDPGPTHVGGLAWNFQAVAGSLHFETWKGVAVLGLGRIGTRELNRVAPRKGALSQQLFWSGGFLDKKRLQKKLVLLFQLEDLAKG